MTGEPEYTERQQALIEALTFRLHFGPPLSEADGDTVDMLMRILFPDPDPPAFTTRNH